MDRAAVIETLNDLIESCKDGELGFQTCAEHARSDTLKELFLRRAAGCRDGADQLQKEVGRLGGNQGAARP